MKRALIISINTLLVLVIAALVLATWMPAIYTSNWFQNSPWVKTHWLQTALPDKAKK